MEGDLMGVTIKPAPLKACPHCGSRGASSFDNGPWETLCGMCPSYTWGETKEESEGAWNRRVEDEIDLRKLQDHLEAACEQVRALEQKVRELEEVIEQNG